MRASLLWLLLPLLLLCAGHASGAMQEIAPLRAAVENFVLAHTTDLPGKSELAIGNIDARLRLAACTSLEAFLPPGSKLWGNSTVGLRCQGPSAWIIYVPVTVKVMARIVVSARPLSPGQVLTEGDLSMQEADLTQLPPATLTDPQQASGKTLLASVPSGYALRPEMLRAVLVIQQGQTVKVITRGKGFSVTSQGRALGHASAGQPVQVRTPSGQVISGIATPEGIVEVPF